MLIWTLGILEYGINSSASLLVSILIFSSYFIIFKPLQPLKQKIQAYRRDNTGLFPDDHNEGQPSGTNGEKLACPCRKGKS